MRAKPGAILTLLDFLIYVPTAAATIGPWNVCRATPQRNTGRESEHKSRVTATEKGSGTKERASDSKSQTYGTQL